MDHEWKKSLQEAQEKIEAIGFFAAIGMHFSESTPLLSEDLGDHVKGTPWERFSSTDQCLKMIHQLAAEVWSNLEKIVAFVEPNVEEEKEPERETIKYKDTKIVDSIKTIAAVPPYFQTIAGEIILLKTMGESIVALAEDGEQVSELDHFQVKSLGEMIINAATTINKNIQEQNEKINQESSREGGVESRIGRPLESIEEEMERIKAFGSSLRAMGLTTHGGFKLNPRQIEAMGQMIVDLADKVTDKLNQPDGGATRKSEKL